MLWLWHTQSHANPTLTPTDTQVISWEQLLQPYLPPGSLMPADTQNISCHSPAARGSTSLRSWKLCTEHRLVLYHPQSQPLLPGECVTQFQNCRNQASTGVPRGTGQAHLCSVTWITARQAAAATGGFVEIKCQPGQSLSRHPESLLCHQPGVKQMPVVSNRNTGHTAALALPWEKAITDRLYLLRLTQRCPGSDQVGHAGGGRKPPVPSEAAGDGEDADLAGLQAPRGSPAAGGAQQV